MVEDRGLALNALASTGVAAELGPIAAMNYRHFADENGAGVDFSGITNAIRDNSEAAAGHYPWLCSPSKLVYSLLATERGNGRVYGEARSPVYAPASLPIPGLREVHGD